MHRVCIESPLDVLGETANSRPPTWGLSEGGRGFGFDTTCLASSLPRASAATRHKNLLGSDVSPKPVAPFQILVPTLQNYSNRFFGFCTIGARRQRNAKNLSWGPERLNNYSDVVGKFAISANPHRPLRRPLSWIEMEMEPTRIKSLGERWNFVGVNHF
jgi:hypothetical protein